MSSHSERAPIRILVVDDDPFIHEMFGGLLNDAEYSLLSAENAKEAIKILAADIPEIIITDAMMPGESGFSLINKIKFDPRLSQIPIILMTILETPNGSVLDASGHADFRVSKPIYLSDITAVLEQAIELGARRREIAARLSEPDPVTVVFS